METFFWKGGSKEPLQALSRPAETRCFLHTGREVGNVSWFFFSKKNCLLSIALPSTTSGAARAAGHSLIVTLDNKPVTLTSLRDPNETLVVDVTLGTDRYTVTYGNKAIEQDVLAHPDDMDYVPAFSSAVTTWNGYLLIEDDGGGNGWRADQAHIFAIRAGRLFQLGIIVSEMQTAGSLVEQEVRDSREFLDLDNQFETNPLTGHADAVGIVIALKENAGRLVYQPKWCWRLNGGDEGRRWNDQHLAQTQGLEATAAQLLQRAAIDRYCDRTDMLVADLDRARALFPPAKYTVLAGLVRHMTVGKLPPW